MNAGVISCFSLLGVGQASFAQERTNVPPVMQKAPPPELPNQMDIVRAFFKENKRMNRPKFILFWNRELSDEVVTYYIDYQAKQAEATGGSISAYGRDSASVVGGTWTGAGVSATSRRSVDISGSTVEATRVDQVGVARMNKDEARKNLDELINMKLESSFKSMFIKGGARLINREMAIRTTGVTAKADEKINTHALETSAMVGKADLLVEIVLTPSFESETGLAFQANVVVIETGETLASVFTEAMPPTIDTVSYEATSNGFVRNVNREGFSDQTIGKQLAIDTMREITDYWRMMSAME